MTQRQTTADMKSPLVVEVGRSWEEAMPCVNLQSHPEAEGLRGRTNPSTCPELHGTDCPYKTPTDPQTTSCPVLSQLATAA